MECHWIIENIARERSYTDLAEEVRKQGFPLQLINGDFKYENIDGKYDEQCVIFNGSIELSKIAKERLNKSFPVIYCNQESYLCSRYYPHFSEYLFNERHCLISLECLKDNKYFFYGVFGKECLLFIRPDRGDKTFRAGLVDLQDFDKFYKSNELFKNELVLISNPKNIRGEWRFIVSHKEIIAVSSYQYQGQMMKIPSAPKGASDLVDILIEKADYKPDSVFCYDIAEDTDGNFWLLELTSFSSAGLYEANKQKIVKEVSQIALEDWMQQNKEIEKNYV